MRRGPATLLATLLTVAATAAACGGGAEGGDAVAARSGQVREAAREAGLPQDVADFLALAAGVGAKTFRVVYDLGGDQGEATLSQDPPRRRVDVARGEGDAATVATVIVDRDDVHTCELSAGRWSCRAGGTRPDDVAPIATDAVERAVAGLRSSTGAYDYRLERRDLAGVEAGCLLTTPKPGPAGEGRPPGTLCISPDGVPLLVHTPRATLTAVRYTTAVPPGTFDLPADPSG